MSQAPVNHRRRKSSFAFGDNHKSKKSRKYTEQDITLLKQQIEDLQIKKLRSYTYDEVVVREEIKGPAQVGREIIAAKTTWNKQLAPHIERLETWQKDMKDLKTQFRVYADENDMKQAVLGSDDEKTLKQDNEGKEEEKHHVIAPDEEPYYELNSTILLRQYNNCTNLLNAQQARSETINEYIKPLNTHRKVLRETMQEQQRQIDELQKQYNDSTERYNSLAAKRIQLKQMIENLMVQLNETIASENEVNQRFVIFGYDLKMKQLEMKEYEELDGKIKSLKAGYSEYIGDIDEVVDEMNDYFEARWDEQERVWPQWSAQDIVCWMKHLNQTDSENKIKLSNSIDLDKVGEKLIDGGICGDALDKLKKEDWISYGVKIFADRLQIHERIQKMIEQYPRPRAVELDEDQEVALQLDIPERFICPISKKIMKEPVICSDNKTYDKEYVESFILENGSLLGSNEEYDATDVMIPNRSLKKEIHRFLEQHNQL